MPFYFQLQWRRLLRLLRVSGLHPYVALVVGAGLFGLLSYALFFKAPVLAPWIYPGLAVGVFTLAGNRERTHPIRNAFPSRQYYQLRWVENLILALPFVLYALAEWEPWTALAVIGLASLLSPLQFRPPFHRAIPTPFASQPFEFPVGFRKSFWVFPLAVFLLVMAIEAENFNLGIFAWGITFLTCAGYYQRPEPVSFVWNFSLTPAAFLNYKLKQAALLSSLVTLPYLVVLIGWHPEWWWGLLIAEVLAIALVGVNLLGKYAFYPSPFNLMQALIFGGSLFFPPAMLVSLPLLYQKAKSNLQPPLQC